MATSFTDLGVCGKTHGDTTGFNDLDLLGGCNDVKLVRLRVWYDDYLYGLQTLYETSNKGMIVSPRRMKDSTDTSKLKYEEVTFNRDEWIEGFGGHHGSIIDHFKLVTNQGRTLRFGTSDGGDPFEIEIPYGKCVGALKGGYGGHIHNIGCAVVPQLPTIQYQYGLPAELKIEGTKSYGPTHADTQNHSDVDALEASVGQHRLVSLTVYYDNNCVFGLCVEYEENGKIIKTKGVGSAWNKEADKQKRIFFTNDEFIKNIYGYIGDYCDFLVIETTNGDVEKFGNQRDPNFNLEIEADKVVTGISFGIGGHLHNITAHYAKRPLLRKFNTQLTGAVEYSLVSKSTGIYGKVHEDTNNFSDFNLIDSSKPSLRLAVLTVYYNPEGGIFGFKHIWTVDGQKIEGDKHRGNSYDDVFGSCDKKNIKLGKGQYITKVYGRSGEYLDQICFEINTGEVFELGGEGGEPFEVALPEGSAVGCITGGIGGHLHNIQVWYGPKNDIQENPSACFYLPIENRFPYSRSIGGTHGDTTAFSDDIDINQQNFRIDTIKIYSTGSCVGVMSIYEVDGQYIIF